MILTQTDEFDIRGEFLWFGVILHSDVYVRWNKGVRKRFRESLRLIAKTLPFPAYAFQAPSHDPKKRKFIESVGLVLDHRRLTGDGEWAYMYRLPSLD